HLFRHRCSMVSWRVYATLRRLPISTSTLRRDFSMTISVSVCKNDEQTLITVERLMSCVMYMALASFIKYAGNCRIWYKNGKIHQDGDLPAIMWDNGDNVWYQNGEIYRDNDQPAVEH